MKLQNALKMVPYVVEARQVPCVWNKLSAPSYLPVCAHCMISGMFIMFGFTRMLKELPSGYPEIEEPHPLLSDEEMLKIKVNTVSYFCSACFRGELKTTLVANISSYQVMLLNPTRWLDHWKN